MPLLGKTAALRPRSTFKRKKKKQKNNNSNIQKEMDFTLKLSLIFDLPTVPDFLINADGQVQEAFFLTTVPSVVHTFLVMGKSMDMLIC